MAKNSLASAVKLSSNDQTDLIADKMFAAALTRVDAAGLTRLHERFARNYRLVKQEGDMQGLRPKSDPPCPDHSEAEIAAAIVRNAKNGNGIRVS